MSGTSKLGANILNPRHPERTCWGCDFYCPAGDLRCGGGTIRTQHPIELFGEDWRPNDVDADELNSSRTSSSATSLPPSTRPPE